MNSNKFKCVRSLLLTFRSGGMKVCGKVEGKKLALRKGILQCWDAHGAEASQLVLKGMSQVEEV